MQTDGLESNEHKATSGKRLLPLLCLYDYFDYDDGDNKL